MERPGPRQTSAESVTVLICTFNRSTLLDETLASLAAMTVPNTLAWDVLVVDNNSTDQTAFTVRHRQATFPVPLRYLLEKRVGKSHALNTGLGATSASFVAFTDDDVRVEPEWLAAAVAPMIADPAIGYTGGPVHPLWSRPRPRWLDAHRSDLWGTIAILDYGPSPFIFEVRRRIPLGANMAVRRDLIRLVGGFDPAFGRVGTVLLGQEQAEFFCRTRSRGAVGLYVPRMAVLHHVPAGRLTRQYFRRWWFWKGIARARLYRRHPDADPDIDFRTTSRFAGIPRFVCTSMARHLIGAATSLARGSVVSAVRHEMMFCYYLGFAREEWRSGAHTTAAPDLAEQRAPTGRSEHRSD